MKKYCISLLIFLFSFILACSKKSTSSTNEVTIDKSGNLLGTGDSANDILSNANFTKLQIEIAYVTGFRPTNESMNEFETFLKERTFKQEIELIFKELPSPDAENLTLNEINDLEQENRTAFNNGNTIAIYIYFADAPSADDDDDQGLVTLGAVYRNTSMVIYESQIRKLASFNSSVSVADVEAATLNHEFGHLFGLVNTGTTPVNDHEDILRDENSNAILDNNDNPIGNKHCNVAGCLMRAELQFGESTIAKSSNKNNLKAGCTLTGKSILKLLESSLFAKSAAQGLDPECILDLQSNGGR